MTIRQGVLAIIFKKIGSRHYFLILKKRYPWIGWEFPKGGLREGEDEQEGLLREIEEETGLADLEIISKIPFEISYNYPQDKQFRGYESAKQSVYLIKLNSVMSAFPGSTTASDGAAPKKR